MWRVERSMTNAIGWRGCQHESAPSCGVPTGRKRKGDDRILASLGANIERERVAHQLTQERLAELVDIHPRVLQKIESGETNLKATTLFRLQAALGSQWESLVPKLSQMDIHT